MKFRMRFSRIVVLFSLLMMLVTPLVACSSSYTDTSATSRTEITGTKNEELTVIYPASDAAAAADASDNVTFNVGVTYMVLVGVVALVVLGLATLYSFK